MKHLTLLALTYVSLVAQTTLASRLEVCNVTPYLPLLAFVAAIGFFEGRSLLVWSAIIGLCCDCLGSGPLGHEMFSLTLVALFVGWLLPRRGTCSPLWTLPASFLILSTALLISAALETTLNHRPVVAAELLRGIAGCAAYTAILAACGRAIWNTILRVFLSPFAALRPLNS